MIHLNPEKLTAESFKIYGHIIGNSSEQPMACNEAFTYWGRVSELKLSDVASTGVLVPHKRELIVSRMERHVRTPEVLTAMEGDSLLCVAKPSPEGSDEIQDLQVFYIQQGTAFALHAGTWHWIPFPVNCETCKFLVIFAAGTEDNDLEVKSLQEEKKIIL